MRQDNVCDSHILFQNGYLHNFLHHQNKSISNTLILVVRRKYFLQRILFTLNELSKHLLSYYGLNYWTHKTIVEI